MFIVKADISTLDELTTLALKLWPDHSRDDIRSEFEELLESEKDIFYLAFVEGVYVGFIHMSLRHDYVEGSHSSPVGYVEGIYVDDKYRRKGISKKLVEAGEQWSKSLGCSQMASDTQLDNDGSQQFHKKIGFREAGRIVAFIKDL
ncbi:Aminoglycoside N(6')-acetyltransferase type 1 [Paenibacillus sp. CECT 9249]|uniref:aminoglycoside 6'-N-acetyltransferase n=1 Tax=Paenibacillus sp. CECT 9249 TaxID=2845385 RepID=UPI001E5B033D|nr:aminoglycoside 6'-N-acetyltransferase [Paenibacillus sp. CECT 9249]CAH0121106.1 Aminoglycoside N(6')-acetyltransferase type 1 [Paenibacillus sp. CECT 9249]